MMEEIRTYHNDKTKAYNLRVSSSSSLGLKAIAESQNFCIIVFAASLFTPAVFPTWLMQE